MVYRLRQANDQQVGVEQAQAILADFAGSLAFTVNWDHDGRRWLVRNSEYVFAFSTVTDAVDVLAAAFDMAGGEYESFTQALKTFGVCKAWRHW